MPLVSSSSAIFGPTPLRNCTGVSSLSPWRALLVADCDDVVAEGSFWSIDGHLVAGFFADVAAAQLGLIDDGRTLHGHHPLQFLVDQTLAFYGHGDRTAVIRHR